MVRHPASPVGPFLRSLALDLTSLLALPAAAWGQATVLRTFSGTSPGDGLGFSVARAGDLNGDAVPDLVVGAPQGGTLPSAPGYARAFSAVDGALLFALNGSDPGDRFGWAVAGAGDVDGDGVPDVIVGAPLSTTPPTVGGYAQVFSGAGGGLLLTLAASAAGEGFGRSVAGPGDLNGDGSADVVVGAPAASPGGLASAGRATVFSGASGLSLQVFPGSAANDQLGSSLAGVGDVDGDLVADVLVGAPQDGVFPTPGFGYARLFSGSTGAVLLTIAGQSNNDYLGRSVDRLGDVSGDGVPDLLVGAPEFGIPGPTGSGYARVLSPSSATPLLSVTGTIGAGAFGTSVAGVGDVNGDLVPDFAVGAPEVVGFLPGQVRVFSGANGAALLAFNGSSPSDQFGFSLAGVGDSNVDGVPDLLVGDPTPLAGAGRAKVVSGAPLPPGTTVAGVGCLGGASFLPYVSTSGSPTVGNAGFGVVLSGAEPLAPTLVIAGISSLSIPLGAVGFPACTLLVYPDFLIPLPADASGIALLTAPVPPNPLLVGALLRFQWLVATTGPAPAMGALTPRLTVQILP
jgi:FG-GAP repeat protein